MCTYVYVRIYVPTIVIYVYISLKNGPFVLSTPQPFFAPTTALELIGMVSVADFNDPALLAGKGSNHLTSL